MTPSPTTSASLTVPRGPHAGKGVSIAGPVFAIGRDVHCQLRPPAQVTSAPIHATIHCQGDTYVIQDHGSTGGTFVNGERIRIARLNSGDLVRIGKFTLQFRVAEKPPLEQRAPRQIAIKPLPRVSPRTESIPKANQAPKWLAPVYFLAIITVVFLGVVAAVQFVDNLSPEPYPVADLPGHVPEGTTLMLFGANW